MTNQEAMKLALEALIWADAKGEDWEKVVSQAIRPMQDALAKQEQGEPVAWADALFAELKHGDEEHQLWLHEKLMSWALKNRKQELGEPFTYYRHYDGGLQDWPDEKTIPLYTTQQRTWVGLSVFEINDLVENTEFDDYHGLVEAVEAKLKERNT